jgi:hypothetical protein
MKKYQTFINKKAVPRKTEQLSKVKTSNYF